MGSCGLDYLAQVAAFPQPDDKLRTERLEVPRRGRTYLALAFLTDVLFSYIRMRWAIPWPRCLHSRTLACPTCGGHNMYGMVTLCREEDDSMRCGGMC